MWPLCEFDKTNFETIKSYKSYNSASNFARVVEKYNKLADKYCK